MDKFFVDSTIFLTSIFFYLENILYVREVKSSMVKGINLLVKDICNKTKKNKILQYTFANLFVIGVLHKIEFLVE